MPDDGIYDLAEKNYEGWVTDPDLKQFLDWFVEGDLTTSKEYIQAFVSVAANTSRLTADQPSKQQWSAAIRSLFEMLTQTAIVSRVHVARNANVEAAGRAAILYARCMPRLYALGLLIRHAIDVSLDASSRGALGEWMVQKAKRLRERMERYVSSQNPHQAIFLPTLSELGEAEISVAELLSAGASPWLCEPETISRFYRSIHQALVADKLDDSGLRLPSGKRLHPRDADQVFCTWNNLFDLLDLPLIYEIEASPSVDDATLRAESHLYEDLGCDEKETLKRVTLRLFEEARSLRESYIPTNAVVDLRIPPFNYCRPFELSHGCVEIFWFTSQGAHVRVGITPDEYHWRSSPAAPASIKNVLFAASIALLRDFWVVEHREKVLGPPRLWKGGPANRGGDGGRGADGSGKLVTYLPRLKYDFKNLQTAERLLNQALDHASRASLNHFRRPHFSTLPVGRRSSAMAEAKCHAHGWILPPGKTFVEGHEFRTGAGEIRLYRSRSASQILFVAQPTKPMQALREYDHNQLCERLRRIYTSREWEMLAYSPGPTADGGIDLLLAREAGDGLERLAIQVTTSIARPNLVRACLAVFTIREATFALIVTSNRPTKDAEALAAKHGIVLAYGPELYHLLERDTEVKQRFLFPQTKFRFP